MLAIMNPSPGSMRHKRGISPHLDTSGLDASKIVCCCSAKNCDSILHNKRILQSLEDDLVNVARIGQLMLSNHRRQTAEASSERLKLAASLQEVEARRKELDYTNGQMSAENTELLKQLDEVNSAVVDSDSRIKLLEDALHSSRHELYKLNVLASRATRLETQLVEMEVERASLLARLVAREQHANAIHQKWKRAETTISYLTEHINEIEAEASNMTFAKPWVVDKEVRLVLRNTQGQSTLTRARQYYLERLGDAGRSLVNALGSSQDRAERVTSWKTSRRMHEKPEPPRARIGVAQASGHAYDRDGSTTLLNVRGSSHLSDTLVEYTGFKTHLVSGLISNLKFSLSMDCNQTAELPGSGTQHPREELEQTRSDYNLPKKSTSTVVPNVILSTDNQNEAGVGPPENRNDFSCFVSNPTNQKRPTIRDLGNIRYMGGGSVEALTSLDAFRRHVEDVYSPEALDKNAAQIKSSLCFDILHPNIGHSHREVAWRGVVDRNAATDTKLSGSTSSLTSRRSSLQNSLKVVPAHSSNFFRDYSHSNSDQVRLLEKLHGTYQQHEMTTAISVINVDRQDLGPSKDFQRDEVKALLSRSQRNSRDFLLLGVRLGNWSLWNEQKLPIGKCSDDSGRTAFKSRTPGVNQNGVVAGFWSPKPTPTKLEPTKVDERSLLEALAEI